MPAGQLTIRSVIQIRERFWSGESGYAYQPLAEKFHVSRQTIAEVVKGETYTLVPGPVYSREEILKRKREMDDPPVEKIRIHFSRGHETYTSLGLKYGISSQSIGQMVRGETFKAHGGPTFPSGRGRIADPRTIPCFRGHSPEMRRKDGSCSGCRAISQRRYMETNPEARERKNRRRKKRQDA